MFNYDMPGEKLILLNTSILTEYGAYHYSPISTEAARAVVQEFLAAGRVVESAIGHPETAALLTDLLDYPVGVSRIQSRQSVGDVALVFKVRGGRIPLGQVMTRREIEAAGYDFGLLTRSE